MVGEPGLLHSTSALAGAVIVGGASLAAAIYSQWYQGRLHRMTREANKREGIYGEFIMSASKILVKVYITDNLSWSRDEQHLIGLINRMRLFAPPAVIAEAESVIRTLVQVSQQPKLAIDDLARASLTDRSVPDLLLCFSLTAKADLSDISDSSGHRHLAAVSRTLASACHPLLDRILQIGQQAQASMAALTNACSNSASSRVRAPRLSDAAGAVPDGVAHPRLRAGPADGARDQTLSRHVIG